MAVEPPGDAEQCGAATGHARTAELLWDPPQRPRRGPRPSLSLDRIVTAAIEVADAEGLAAVSMQRVATDLGFAKMSLYRYTPGKAELVALMVDTALGPPPDLGGVPGGWRPRLRAWATHMDTALRRHPWTLEATVGARVLGPNELGWLEAAVATLAETGLDGAKRLDTVALLAGHVRNLVQQAPTNTGDPDGDGSVERDLHAVMGGVLAAHHERYPHASAAFAAAAASAGQDNALEFGLERILDGVAALLDRD